MTNEEYQFTLAQILLIDPMSDSPKIHSKRKNMPKRQLIRRLEKLIQEYEESEVLVDLSIYKESIERLKSIKTDKEYAELIQEIVDCYDPSYGVLDESSVYKVPKLESSKGEESKSRSDSQIEEQVILEKKEVEKKEWISSLLMNLGREKKE